MAITFNWPVKFTESRTVRDLKARIVDLEKRAIGGVNIPGELFNTLFDGEHGIKVTTENATSISAVYQAFNILVDSINIPVEVYRRKPDGDRVPVDESSPYEYRARNLIHVSPNMLHTPSQWFQLMELSRAMYGNGYSHIIRNGLQEPLALVWYHPNNVDVRVRNGMELRYDLKNDSGNIEWRDVSAMDMIHVKNMSFNGYLGRGIIDIAADSLSGGLAAQRTGNKFYQDGMTSKVVLSHPGQLTATGKQNLQSSFDDEMKKKSNIILEEGTKLYTVTIPPEQAQFLESRVFSVTEVSRWFNIPEHMLSNNQHSTFSNIENQFGEFQIMNLRPRVRAWEQELNWKLLTNYKDFYFEFNMDALMRPDTVAQSQYFATMVQNGMMLRNEVRALKNLNKLPGGDEALTPMNLQTEGQREKSMEYKEPAQPEPPQPEDEPTPDEEQDEPVNGRKVKILTN